MHLLLLVSGACASDHTVLRMFMMMQMLRIMSRIMIMRVMRIMRRIIMIIDHMYEEWGGAAKET
jgi:hypothetical protein